MSRRKQSHPKSMKGNLHEFKDDQRVWTLPSELIYNENSNEILARIDLKRHHCFGPYPAVSEIQDHIESFHLLNSKDNWLVYCSTIGQSTDNFNLIFQNNQLMVMIKEDIPMGTRLCSNKIIRMKIKEEKLFLCDLCGIRFSNENILIAHREHYCNKRTKSIESTKRRSSDESSTIPAKRSCTASCDTVSTQSDKYFQQEFLRRPIQIGQFIYVPIPVMTNNRPLDLSRTKTNEENLYQCQFCSIRFRQRETLQAHQENYCSASQQHSSSNHSLYTCRLCQHSENNLERMHLHLQYHLVNGQSCSKEDILTQSMLFKCLICLAMFEDENILLDHVRCVHINSKLIQCLECRSKFSSKWNLIRHMKILHTNIHSEQQQQQDDKHSNLIRSSSMTMNNKTNYCSFCQIAFRQKSSYQAHRLFYCSKRRRQIST